MVLTGVLGRLPDVLRELDRVPAWCIEVLRKWEGPLWEPDTASLLDLPTV